MAKSNPLFVDSTKMTGDSIGTQIELSRVALYEDEILKVIVTNHLNEVICEQMNLNEEMNYQTRVWMRHQKSFTYQFVIEKGDTRVLQSAPKQVRARYAILDQWTPVLAEPNAAPVELESIPRQSIQDQVRTVADLMGKFGF